MTENGAGSGNGAAAKNSSSVPSCTKHTALCQLSPGDISLLLLGPSSPFLCRHLQHLHRVFTTSQLHPGGKGGGRGRCQGCRAQGCALRGQQVCRGAHGAHGAGRIGARGSAQCSHFHLSRSTRYSPQAHC